MSSNTKTHEKISIKKTEKTVTHRSNLEYVSLHTSAWQMVFEFTKCH